MLTDKQKEIARLLSDWNIRGAQFRDRLRVLINWDNNSSAEEFGLKIVEELGSGSKISPLSGPAVQEQEEKTKLTLHLDEETKSLLRATYRVERTCDEIIEKVNASGWDKIDPGGWMNKTPQEVSDFLESLHMECPIYRDLHESRRRLFQMILESWVRWINLQHA